MGLDMYAFCTQKTNIEDVKKDFFSSLVKDSQEEEFFYWRKHPALHGWMEKKFLEKVLESDEKLNQDEATFNNIYMKLDKEDLLHLEKDLKDFNLPWDTSGFFFGSDNPQTLNLSKEQKKKHFENIISNDLEFVEKALQKIDEEDLVVLYYSSW